MGGSRWSKLIMPLRKAWGLMLDREVPLWMKLIPAFAVLYILSPLDIIPDVIVGPGQLDDLGVLIIALSVFFRLVPKDVIEKHVDKERSGSKAKADLKKDEVIEEGEFEEI